MAAAISKAESNKEPVRPATRWLPLVIAATAVCLAAACGYYVLKFFRGSTANDERAFRALGEITGQFANLQETMGSLLQLVPRDAQRDNTVGKRYVASLALEGLQLAVAECARADDPGPAFDV